MSDKFFALLNINSNDENRFVKESTMRLFINAQLFQVTTPIHIPLIFIYLVKRGPKFHEKEIRSSHTYRIFAGQFVK